MPQRLLRPTLRQSKRWNRLPYFEQTLYIRLITLADDYGRYEADPELLCSEAFPFGDPVGTAVKCQSIDIGLLALVRQGMLLIYNVEDKKYLQILRWKERTRSESKFPDPKCGHLTDICPQMIASPPSPSPSPSPIVCASGVGSSASSNSSACVAIAPQTATLKFKKPELDELKLHAAKIGLPEDQCIHFLNHYEANGWKVGRNPMKSWPHALQNWKLNFEKGTYAKNGRNHFSNPPQHVDRSKGTANEGQAHKYRGLGRVASNPNAQ